MERGNSTSISVWDPSLRRKHCVDRISDLPDSIIGHILSFLPTENAVATGILSQRWKFLWTTISNLDLLCWPPCREDRFVNFVNYVLLLHKPGYLNRFTLTWGTRCMPFYVNVWISTAISRNVRKLILYVEIYQFPIHIQRSIFSCGSLQSLELNVYSGFCISREISFSLPNLESLKLESVIFESEETLCKLLGGCPVLKDLCLTIKMVKTKQKCHLDDRMAFRCTISSTSLRRLVLFADDEDQRYESICGVQLDAPSLKYVKLDYISSISIGQTPIFLVEADFQLVDPDYDYEEQDHHKSVVEAFCAFDCAKKLVLNFGVIKAFMSAPFEMKLVFNKLTRLEVTKDFIYWIELHHFLRWLGNLEVFIVRKESVGWYDSEEEENLIAAKPNLVPRCLSNSLRLVAIRSCCDYEDDFAMVSYILKHASVLELMAIPFYDHDDLQKKITKLPRKSPLCEVDFTWDAYDRISKS